MDHTEITENFENLITLAELVEATGVASQYFEIGGEIKHRFLKDACSFVLGIEACWFTDRDIISAVDSFFRENVGTSEEIVPQEPFLFKSPLIVAVVDRLYPIDGQRGQFLKPFLEIYSKIIDKCLYDWDQQLSDLLIARFRRFVEKVDSVANKITDWKSELPFRLEEITIPKWLSEEIDSDNEDETSDTQADDDALIQIPKLSLPELLEELNNLVGLEQVKSEVISLINLIRVRQLRTERGLDQPPMSLHLVFTGNPGTGKTTVARLLSQIYYHLGLLSKGHLVEVDRSHLVAGYIGQTALKVQEVIKNAMGGVLFIDEAYALTSSGSPNDFGFEAVE